MRRTVDRLPGPRWLPGMLVLAGLLMFLGWHYLTLGTSLTGARGDLVAVEELLRTVGVEVEAADIERARDRVDRADVRIASAQRHLRWDPLLQLARHTPIAGDQVEAVYGLTAIGGTVVDLGHEALDLGDRIVRERDAGADRSLTAFGVELLDDLEPQLVRLGQLTDRLVDQRLALGDEPLLPPLHAARARLDEELPGLAVGVRRGLEARDLLSTVLGFEGERRYLLLALNNGELLPGGGLVSVAGVMSVLDGRPGELDFTNTGRWKPAWDDLEGPYIPPPGPLRRYLLRDFSWNLGTSNWSPDFPTWAQQALEFYRLVWDPGEVDGVIAVDLEVLTRLLRVTGPKVLETEGYGRVRLTPSNAVLELERITRQPFEPGQDKKAPVGDLAELMLRDLLRLPSNRWSELVEAMSKLGHERHIQLFMFDGREQALIRSIGWSGHLVAAEGDYLQFNEASLNSTKLNLVIQPEGSYRVEVNTLGDARHELRLRYANTLPQWRAGKDPELVSRLMLKGQYGGYLRAFAPPDAVDFRVEIDGAPAGVEDIGRDGGYAWFGAFLALPSGAEREVVMRWTVPLATAAAGASSYDLYIQKQPGTRGMCLDLAVERDGAPAAALEVEGGTRDDDGRVCLTSDVRVHAELS